jgi:hypothetical protein
MGATGVGLGAMARLKSLQRLQSQAKTGCPGMPARRGCAHGGERIHNRAMICQPPPLFSAPPEASPDVMRPMDRQGLTGGH